MLKMQYPASILQSSADGDWVVKFPDLDGAITGAATYEEAFDEASDCLGSWMSFALRDQQGIPPASRKGADQFMISVPLWIAPKVALYRAMEEQSISKTEMGRRLGVRETVVRRMLDPDHATKTQKLQAALRAAGKQLLVVVEEAA